MDNIKNQMRLKIKKERNALTEHEKNYLDKKIFDNILKSKLLENHDTIFVYLSTDIEVSTVDIVNYCFENDLKVAIPRCVGKREMKFFYYFKNSVLEKSKYGIYEPVLEKSREVKSFENSLCIVPGLAFDKNGFRLGYGGGFYDKFLNDNPDITTVGICYSRNIADNLPKGDYDKYVDYVITDNDSYKIMEVCNG